MKHLKKIIYCSLLLLPVLLSHAQKQKTAPVTLIGTSLLPADSNQKVCIRNLEVSGTKKTKIYIVYREIHFKKGDSLIIADLQKQLEQARRQVYNTTLFNEVSFTLSVTDSLNVDINVHVTERWYLYPVPQFQLVDRNLNEWWKTYHHSLDRVNYGIKFVHYNLSGRRDQLRIFLINGYTRNISFSYSNPYSNRSLTNGFVVTAGYSQSRETPYKTDSANGILLLRETGFSRQSIYGGIGFSIRTLGVGANGN
ncbi:MAG TPA: POTRA domain-containing protein [Ferruginibacter sp.]|nr:POTRA domain-containing protein [Ferruginibacter sp.]